MRKKYASTIRAGILAQMQFRLSLLVTTLGNLLYLLLVYHLWKAIFASSDAAVINGMSFEDTMIYLVFASALGNFMEMWIVWNMGRDFQSGQIIIDLLKPVSYRTYRFFDGFGECIVKFITTFLPTAIVVYLVIGSRITLGINVCLFIFAAMMSMLINFYINFITGTICMYTQSIWGVNIVKVVILSLLSGATIPIAFFPEGLSRIVLALPFQAIISMPRWRFCFTRNTQPDISA